MYRDCREVLREWLSEPEGQRRVAGSMEHPFFKEITFGIATVLRKELASGMSTLYHAGCPSLDIMWVEHC